MVMRGGNGAEDRTAQEKREEARVKLRTIFVSVHYLEKFFDGPMGDGIVQTHIPSEDVRENWLRFDCHYPVPKKSVHGSRRATRAKE